jgi:cell division protein FtsW
LTAWLGRPLASFHLVLAVFGLLTAIGLVMVASASPVESLQHGSMSVYALFKKQLAFAMIGTVVFWLGLRVPLRRIRSLAAPGVAVCVALLVLVLTPLGHRVSTTRGWFVFGPVSFQPVPRPTDVDALVCAECSKVWPCPTVTLARTVTG